VGNEDFLRRVDKQVTGVEQETSVQEGVRDNGITSAAAEAFLSCQRVDQAAKQAGGVRSFAMRTSRKDIPVPSPHAFQLLPDDCSHDFAGTAACLCVLSIGFVRSLVR
jgi:hypothetical protein